MTSRREAKGASRDDLGAPFSFLPSRRERLLTTRRRAVVLPSAAVRSLREARLASLPCYRPAEAAGGLCIGCSRADRWGFGGPSAPNKLRRVYTGALFAATVSTL